MHRQTTQSNEAESASAELFLSGLIAADGLAFFEFPAETLNDLPARVSRVDQTCKLLGRRWEDDSMVAKSSAIPAELSGHLHAMPWWFKG